MKKLILLLCAAIATHGSIAKAQADDCSKVLEAMTSLINTDIDVIKTCYQLEQQNKTSSKEYQDEKFMSKKIALTYADDVQTCLQVCIHSYDCEGPAPTGDDCKK